MPARDYIALLLVLKLQGEEAQEAHQRAELDARAKAAVKR